MNPNIDPYWRSNNMLNGVNEDTPIYKYMPIQYTLSMLQNQLLVMGRVNAWDDVYENYILKQNYSLPDGTPIDVVNQADGVFGQCWTLKQDSDAMWRIYSPNQDAIRIRTTVGKLFDTLYVADNNMVDTYIGSVLYKNQAQIDADVQNLSPLSPGAFLQNMIQSAFVKRMEFNHEEEVRIVRILDSENTRVAGNLLSFAISPTFIEELCIDPRVDSAMEQNYRAQLVAAGADPGIIMKSPLYQFNTHQIVFQ